MATQYKISGVIEGSDGSKSEFLMIAGLGGGAWSQWGDVTQEQKADRVEYLDAMSTGLADNSDYYRQESDDEEFERLRRTDSGIEEEAGGRTPEEEAELSRLEAEFEAAGWWPGRGAGRTDRRADPEEAGE